MIGGHDPLGVLATYLQRHTPFVKEHLLGHSVMVWLLAHVKDDFIALA